MHGELPPILVVDDEKNIRASIQTMLQEESYAVQTVDSAEAGLKRRSCIINIITIQTIAHFQTQCISCPKANWLYAAFFAGFKNESRVMKPLGATCSP